MGCCESYESEDEENFARVSIGPLRIPEVNELLAEKESIDQSSARNLVGLFESKNTVPFICRYRRNLIGENVNPERLRHIKNTYIEIISLRKKAQSIVTQLERVSQISEEVRAEILSAKNIRELEFLETKYIHQRNVSSQRFKREALELLIGKVPPVDLWDLIDHRDSNLDTFEKVVGIVCETLSEILSKNPSVREELNRFQKTQTIMLQCTKNESNPDDDSTNKFYFDFKKDIRFIKPHQILAINRGERTNCLEVSLYVMADFKANLTAKIFNLFIGCGIRYRERNWILDNAIENCYNQYLMPFMYRSIRDELTDKGKKAALDVFARNLQQLLLTPPVKGEPILGIDPGFKNGCKLAVISEKCDVLDVSTIYPHIESTDPKQSGETLAKMLTKHKCKRIALGNGVGCRETEAWLTGLMESGIINREKVRYEIVSERGASVYSCSDTAKKEFPDLDVNLISAVSIARRLNDPLSEYVKIEPRHLGIGMYQHDINSKLLERTLNEVTSMCVSYVGVDVNTASLSLLKFVAGLNENTAQKIIEHRRKHGPFIKKANLLHVESISPSVYLQCAGFLRIEPKSVGGKRINKLDCTWIHPENYSVAEMVITHCSLHLKDIGKKAFISKVKAFASSHPIEVLANSLGITVARLRPVLDALQSPLFNDYRRDLDQNLFKCDVTQFEDIFIGQIVTGKVTNVVDFGAFVDVGLPANALIHKSKMNKQKVKLGDKVSATVLDLDEIKKQIELRLDELL